MITRFSKGSALLSALFIMSLVAALTTLMLSRLHMELQQSRTVIIQDKLFLAAQGMTLWAVNTLSQADYPLSPQQKKLHSSKKIQHIYPEVTLKATLYDLQAKFNINNILRPIQQNFFSELLKKALPKLTLQERDELLAHLIQWIKPYTPGMAQEPFLQSNQPMSSISELRLVKGITAKYYLALIPYLIALPENNLPLNINTMPSFLLSTLRPGLTEAQIERLIEARKKGIKNINELTPLLNELLIAKELLTTESQYFLCEVESWLGQERQRYYFILHRYQYGKNKVRVSVLQQTINISP